MELFITTIGQLPDHCDSRWSSYRKKKPVFLQK